MTTTIDLEARPRRSGQQFEMSATSPVRPAAHPSTWLLPSAWRARQQHRAAAGPGPVRRAVPVVTAVIAWFAVTLWNIGREFGAHAAAMSCLVIAAATVSDTLGWLAAGLVIMWTQHLRTPSGTAPPR